MISKCSWNRVFKNFHKLQKKQRADSKISLDLTFIILTKKCNVITKSGLVEVELAKKNVNQEGRKSV